MTGCSSKKVISDADLDEQFSEHASSEEMLGDASESGEAADSSAALSEADVAQMYEAAGVDQSTASAEAPASTDYSVDAYSSDAYSEPAVSAVASSSNVDYTSYDPNMTPAQTLVYASQHATSRGPASQPKGKGAFWTLSASPCGVYAAADSNSQVFHNLSDGRSLWVEPAQAEGWVMVQRQAGPAYMQSQCFQ